MAAPITQKDPDETKIFEFGFKYSMGSSEVIDTVAFEIESGLTNAGSATDAANQNVQLWLSGGTVGQRYTVTCRVTTTNSQTLDNTILIDVVEKENQ